MYRTEYAYLQNEHDAIEAVQEATYRSLKKIHTLKEPSYVGTWLVRIYFHQYENYLQGEAEIEVPLQ